MDNIYNIVGLVIATFILILIAFPDRILPIAEPKKKKVGSTYWGAYEGQPTEDSPNEGRIEVQTPAPKEKVISGSHLYNAGRGTSFRS